MLQSLHHRYTCDVSGAKITTRDAVQVGDISDLHDSLAVTCLDTTEWSLDMDLYECTPECKIPFYNSQDMVHNWLLGRDPQVTETVE